MASEDIPQNPQIVTREGWYAKNKDKVSSKRKARYAADEQYRKESHDRVREWIKNNPERRKAIKAKWLNANRDKHNAGTKRWAEENKEKRRISWIKRKATKRNADGIFTKEDIGNIYKAQRGRCAYCRMHLGDSYHIDHIVPLSKGGSNWPSNLQLTCGHSGNRCNLKKNDKDPLMFARELGRLL